MLKLHTLGLLEMVFNPKFNEQLKQALKCEIKRLGNQIIVVFVCISQIVAEFKVCSNL